MKIRLDILQAALLFAGKSAEHPRLHGVHLDSHGRVTAMDGISAFMGLSNTGEGPGVTIKTATLQAALSLFNGAPEVEYLFDGGHYLKTPNSYLPFDDMDMDFPDVSRLCSLPDFTPQVRAKVDIDQENRISKAAKVLNNGDRKTKNNYYIYGRHEAPCGVLFGGRRDCFAVVMPLKQLADYPDSWVNPFL